MILKPEELDREKEFGVGTGERVGTVEVVETVETVETSVDDDRNINACLRSSLLELLQEPFRILATYLRLNSSSLLLI